MHRLSACGSHRLQLLALRIVGRRGGRRDELARLIALLEVFPLAEQRGDGIGVPSAEDGSAAELASRLEAQEGHSAGRTIPGIAADRTANGPQHDPMAPYARPKLEARAAAGSNPSYDAAYAAAHAAYGTRTGTDMGAGLPEGPQLAEGEALFAALV